MSLNRVIWKEGMVLMPQHFQQQEHFLMGQSDLRIKKQFGDDFGFDVLELDSEKLQHGFLSFKFIQGIWPDGTAFSCPDNASMPDAYQLNNSHINTTLYLCTSTDGIKSLLNTSQDISLSPYSNMQIPSKVARYLAEEIEVSHVNELSTDTFSIESAKLHLRICSLLEITNRDIAMPIAFLKSLSDKGEAQLQNDFIPPLLNIHAHEGLSTNMKSLLNLIKHRTDWQMRRLNQPQTSSLFEMSDFLMLQTLMRHESILRFELAMTPAKPVNVYRQLIALASELGAVENPPKRVDIPPSWNLMTLNMFFQPLLEALNAMLSNLRERLSIELNIKASSDGIFVNQNTLPVMSNEDRIVIAAQAQVPDDWFWHRFNGQAIISSSDSLVERVRLQMKGVDIKHLSSTPPELPLQAGWHYYELERNGLAWREILQSRSLGIYVAGHWQGLVFRAWLLHSNMSHRVNA